MSQRYDHSRSKQNSSRENSRLAFEQLEARLMNAIDTIDYNLNLFNDSSTVGSVPSLSAVSPTPNSAPSFSSQTLLTGSSQVTSRTTTVSVLGADDKGESNLRYNWQTVSQPAGGLVSFASNGTNAAKRNALTFNKAGMYEVRVTIQDQEGLTTNSTLRFNVVSTLTSLRATTPNPSITSSAAAINTVSTTQRLSVVGLDQFETPMAVQPRITWRTTSAPSGGNASLTSDGNSITASFSQLGSYSLRAESSSLRRDITINVVPTVTSVSITTPDNRIVTSEGRLSVTGSSQRLSVAVLDQFRQPLATQPAISWTTASTPPDGSATNSLSGKDANFTFNRAGSYVLRAMVGSQARYVTLDVVQALSGLTVTPGTSSVATGATQRYRIQAVDQFQQAIAKPPVGTIWSATGGTITGDGLFTAGNSVGSFTITANIGTRSNSVAVQVTAATPSTTLRNQALANLVTSLYADNQLSRLEMIQILRSAGSDGTVDSTELVDLRYIVSSNSTFAMPSHVRELARDVVNSNAANQTFKGQAAGNLAAGSSSTLLNNLVDKWFLGADEPILTTSSLSYQTVVGSLFNTTPSRADAKQGMLGDCYFIAALASIADKNADAVRNMFIDNGDETYTIRFYGGSASGSRTADYVTVNRRLPAYSNGALGYSSYGMSILSAATPLWIAFAEKAYAQWNETGQAGRDGTNRYAAIEGGWMANVNAQVLGYNSSNYAFASSSKQTLVDALNSTKSVTLGTMQNASAGGLVGSHAYSITGYNATTDTFSLHNPWGVSHPTHLSWSQLQSNCSYFVVADPAGSVAINQASVRSQVSEVIIGNWTLETPILATLNGTHEERDLVFDSETSIIVTSDVYKEQGSIDSLASGDEIVTTPSTDESSSKEQIYLALNADLVDIAMASIKLNGVCV